jgi:hypothetical protein
LLTLTHQLEKSVAARDEIVAQARLACQLGPIVTWRLRQDKAVFGGAQRFGLCRQGGVGFRRLCLLFRLPPLSFVLVIVVVVDD